MSVVAADGWCHHHRPALRRIIRPGDHVDLINHTSAISTQIGGDHYKKLPIQPAEYVHKNNIPYLEGSVIYYVTRWRDKGGLADIDKAIHTLQLLKELEHGQKNQAR